MEGYFELMFPLVVDEENSFRITYTSQEGAGLSIGKGLYYIDGDNGAGKTTLMNLLALLAGPIGEKVGSTSNGITFMSYNYRGKGFDHIQAAEIREQYFCIFPQKAFFLPVSTRDNYWVLNGRNAQRAALFSAAEYPDLLSGGLQQQILMDIVLDGQKPVWFLDEPMTHLDLARRRYFWQTLWGAWRGNPLLIFFIEHWLSAEIRGDENFELRHRLTVDLEIGSGGEDPGEAAKISSDLPLPQT